MTKLNRLAVIQLQEKLSNIMESDPLPEPDKTVALAELLAHMVVVGMNGDPIKVKHALGHVTQILNMTAILDMVSLVNPTKKDFI